MREPFLFRFKERCQSPNRSGIDDSYRYDPDLDMVIDTITSPNVPAIESSRKPGPRTKKKDIEKGDDQKDRRMWQ
jgi:hypothetical protein